ncbi:hypothetical protein ABN028_20010 [Actinopolymorpha sp. B17G11]|uniref:hypothetical protein n=1 Tax=Actinopolymorpha sp. B17G11 TaxID=3160861 RepID=UPI0032E3ED55
MVKVLDAEQVVVAGVNCWRLLLDTDRGVFTYLFPAYTFEARAAEYGIDDQDELLEMVLLEWLDTDDEAEPIDPYSEVEPAARQKKRGRIAAVRRRHEVSFDVHKSKGDMQAFLRSKMRVDAENVDVLRDEVVKVRAVTTARQAKAKAMRAAAASSAPMDDAGGALAAAKEARLHRERAAAQDV